jgi:hypothetical protein
MSGTPQPLAVARRRTYVADSQAADTFGGGGLLLLVGDPTAGPARISGRADDGLRSALALLTGTPPSRERAGRARGRAGDLLVTWQGGTGRQAVRLSHAGGGGARGMTRFTVEPAEGPVRVAAPAEDADVLAWLVAQGHAGPALRERLTEARLRAWRARLRARMGVSRAPRGPAGPGAPTSGGRSLRGRIAAATRVVARATDRVRDRLRRPREAIVVEGDAVPAWLAALARDHEVDPPPARIGLVVPGDFLTQKILVFCFPAAATRPSVVVKLARDPAVNERIVTARDALSALAELPLPHRGAVPRLVLSGELGPLALVGEEIIRGEPLGDADPATWLPAAADLLLDIAVASRRTIEGGALAEALGDLLKRFTGLHHPDEATLRVLHDGIERIAAAPSVPLVLQHGDPGAWNLLRRTDGGIALLDWENAEPAGLPVADLAFLLRSAGVIAARRAGIHDRIGAGSHAFLAPDRVAIAADLMTRLVERIGLDGDLVEPLFYHGWMLQALREATRLPAGGADRGIHARTLAHLAAARARPELGRVLRPGSVDAA